MPYEEAQARVLIAVACDRLDDRDGREIELDAARRLFTRLGAAPALTRIVETSARGTTPRRAGGLSERETQVLRLLATGKTNRAIAEQLFISEKTVARHVSNILSKRGRRQPNRRDSLGLPAQPRPVDYIELPILRAPAILGISADASPVRSA